MNFKSLSENNIFVVPVGDYWNVESDRLYMVYAPLSGSVSLGTRQSVAELESCSKGTLNDEAIRKIVDTFKAKGSIPVHYLPETPHQLYQIDLLINYTCNFKCIYCYSAAGRSSKQVEFEKIKTVIDYLFCSGKKQVNPYIINFSGGGEPLLSFPLIKQAVEYIESVAKGTDYKYTIGLVTNGSLITADIVDYFKEKNVDMAVSFEIIEHLQNKERGSYESVANNIDMMLERGFPFGIRTTFTPESVTYMCDMIEELAKRFPGIKRVVYDTVLSPDLFETPEELSLYYDNFISEYYKAKEKGSEYGIMVESIAVETLSMLRDRTCEGKIVLTPMGTISSCARVSSPQEALYDDYIYGTVNDGQIQFDNTKFNEIISESNIYSQEECKYCYAKWNCGGGCRLFNQSFSKEYFDVRCNFVRKGLGKQLFNVLCENYKRSSNQELFPHIEQMINRGEL